MSYNQKPPGSSGSGMSGGPPNGPNNMPQVAKTFAAGIQQQMQNLVHGQNAIPQSSQADINAFLQQQRIQSMLKQQQQFLQFQHQMQQQQHQQQQHQHHNMAGGGGVGGGPVGGPGAVGPGPGSVGSGGNGEPLALTRTPGAADLLNKTYQQQANGNPATNPTFNQLQQTLQALPTNIVQQLQVFQYQMQAKQMQQQHGGSPSQHSHGQQQPVQGVPPPPPPTTTPMSQQQQQHQQKHQNHYQQQQNAALSRYLTAAAAQAAAVSGNKMSSVTPPPPLTNQMKPPNLPPNTQITPVAGTSVGSGNLSAVPHPKMSTGNTNSGSGKHQTPPPSISLTPSKQAATAPSVAHQQNKFTPPMNTGVKGGHLVHSPHSQNLPKSTHGANTASSSTTSPAKTCINSDAIVAALKSPQSTPVQLTKQMPPMAPTATLASVSNKADETSTIVTGVNSTVVSLHKSTAQITITPSINNTSTSTLAATPIAAANISQSKMSAAKPVVDESAATKLPIKSSNTDNESPKPSLNDSNKSSTDSSAIASVDKTETENQVKEKKLEMTATNKSAASSLEIKESLIKEGSDLKTNSTITPPVAILPPIESKVIDDKLETSAKTKTENDNVESENKSLDVKKAGEKNKLTSDKDKPLTPETYMQETLKKAEAVTDDKKPSEDLKQVKNNIEEIKLDKKDENSEKVNKFKDNVASKNISKNDVETEKSNLVVEKKSSTTVQAVSAKTHEKTDANIKNLLEKNKSEKVDFMEEIKDEKKPITSALSVESPMTKNIAKTENIKDASKEKEEQSKPIKSSEKPTAATPSKPALSNKVNAEDNVKDFSEIPQKETLTASTPAKKVGRLAKGAKSKASTITLAENKTSEAQEDKPTTASVRVKRKPKTDNCITSESISTTPKENDSDRKSKRHRLKTILYQSPLPELAYITKLSASEASNSPKPMPNEDRLIVFYKNEYMAVRNAEGTFYLCQTMQNVYRTSPRISIRWLSEDPKDNNVFIPDFYDHTDIECVLTTVDLKRIDKGHLRLPKPERSRIESILKKAIDVEKGLVPRPELTEENPDGLDISLFKDESQIEKKSSVTDGDESMTPTAAARKSRRGNTLGTSTNRKSGIAAGTPSTSAGNKRKRAASSAASASLSSRKSQTKRRKTLVKRKKNAENSDEDEETSDDFESDTEYKPTQKRSSLNTSCASKTAPRAQRSPLAKARAASPITPTTSRSKNVPQKTTPTPSTLKASRGERAAKRKSITDAGSCEEALTPVKKQMTTSNNKSKASDKVSNEATPVITSDNTLLSNVSSSKLTSSTTTSSSSVPHTSATNSPHSVNNGGNGDGSGGISGVGSTNRSARSRK